MQSIVKTALVVLLATNTVALALEEKEALATEAWRLPAIAGALAVGHANCGRDLTGQLRTELTMTLAKIMPTDEVMSNLRKFENEYDLLRGALCDEVFVRNFTRYKDASIRKIERILNGNSR